MIASTDLGLLVGVAAIALGLILTAIGMVLQRVGQRMIERDIAAIKRASSQRTKASESDHPKG